ncbi:MAG: hypothetical protein ACREBV_02315 [Candidatus Zixiibacteriota bacterium]
MGLDRRGKFCLRCKSNQ